MESQRQFGFSTDLRQRLTRRQNAERAENARQSSGATPGQIHAAFRCQIGRAMGRLHRRQRGAGQRRVPMQIPRERFVEHFLYPLQVHCLRRRPRRRTAAPPLHVAGCLYRSVGSPTGSRSRRPRGRSKAAQKPVPEAPCTPVRLIASKGPSLYVNVGVPPKRCGHRTPELASARIAPSSFAR
jgi:hypothetical protein